MIKLTSSRIAVNVAFIITACLFSVGSLQAQSHSLEVTIPFDFYAGDKLLPAGDYQAATLVNNFVRLYNPATRKSAAFATISLSKVLGETVSPKLIFNKYGEDHFLSEMWWGRGSVGISPIASKLEIELAKVVRPVRIEAKARQQ